VPIPDLTGARMADLPTGILAFSGALGNGAESGIYKDKLNATTGWVPVYNMGFFLSMNTNRHG
jgi:hypothetical protein